MSVTLQDPPAGASAALLDVQGVADLLCCSTRHVYRLADRGAMPRPVRLSALVRWRLRTGDPMTGLLDWIDAGCPSRREARR
jgi:predicted DNA-binding transcriptional regulator AlpA